MHFCLHLEINSRKLQNIFFFQDEKSLEKAVNERKTHDVHESVHRETIMKVTNKMQLYKLIYYS